MQEIAHATFAYEHYAEVMGMLYRRLSGAGAADRKNWRRVYKSLLVLNYLVRNGSERVVTSAREHLYDLRALESFTYVDEFNKDQGEFFPEEPYFLLFVLYLQNKLVFEFIF